MANYNSSHTGAEIDSAIGRVKDTAVTAGTVSASLGVVVDANKDISGFRNVTLTGQLQAATINLTGDTTIGDGDSDNITINADVNSNIIPNTDNTFDLGSASKQWKDLYVNGIGYIDQLGTDADPIAIYASSGEIDGTAIGSESASTGAFTTISASGNVDFNGDLDVDGTTNLDVVDIDGAVDMASTLAVGDAVTFAKSTNGDYKTKIYNANAGTATEANIYITNSSSDADGLFAGIGGTSFTTAGGFVQDGAWIGSGTGASGGLSLMTRASADMRFYTNGHTNLAMVIDSSQNVGIDQSSPSSFYSGASNLVIGNTSQAESGLTIVSSGGASSYGEIFFADGTTGNEAYRGFIQYNHDNSTDSLLFGTAGSERMRINSSGRINATIDIDSGSDYLDGDASLYLANSGTAGTMIKFGDTNAGLVYGGSGTGTFKVMQRQNTAVFIDASRNVGLGDTSPSSALTNFGSASKGLSIKNAQPTIALTDSDTGSGHFWIANGGGISYFQNTVSGATMRFYVESLLALEIENDGVLKSTDGIEFTGTALTGSQTGIASSGANGNLRFYTNGNQAMTLTTGKELAVAQGSTNIGGTINAFTQNGRWGIMVDDIFGNDALIDFRDNGSSIGNITIVSGNVSYNTFIGSHYSSLTTDNEDDIEIGTVLSTIDETHTRHLAKFKVSDVVGDTRVYGVFAGWDGMYEGEGTQATISALGATQIRVTGACQGGDLLESNGDGTAKVQDDDIIRSKTIGKVTIGDSDTGVKLVSCVLYCG